MSELRKVVLMKDYPVRHDIIIETGSAIHIGEQRILQLKKGGFVEEEADKKKAKEALKNARVKIEEKPQTVIHKIEQ